MPFNANLPREAWPSEPSVAWMTVEVPFRPLSVDQSDVRYVYGPDSTTQAGVPAGETFQFDWEESKVYPGTSRKFSHTYPRSTTRLSRRH